MDTRTLFQLTADMAAIEDALWESGGELTEDLELALTETRESLPRKVDSYNGLIRSFDSTADTLDAEIERLTRLRKTAKNASENLRKGMLRSMTENGYEKLEGTKCKVSLVRSKKIETNDEVILAPYLAKLEEFRKELPDIVQVPDLKVSKVAIKTMHKESGILPTGAAIVESLSLRIR